MLLFPFGFFLKYRGICFSHTIVQQIAMIGQGCAELWHTLLPQFEEALCKKVNDHERKGNRKLLSDNFRDASLSNISEQTTSNSS